MSDEFEDEFDGDNEGASNVVKQLRQANKAKEKALSEALEKLRVYEAATRTTTVAKLIEEAGGNPAYAEFYTGEDADPNAVKAWIDSKSSLLGIQAKSEPDPQQDQIERISFAASNAPQPKLGSPADLGQNLAAAKTVEEKNAAIAAIFAAGRPS